MKGLLKLAGGATGALAVYLIANRESPQHFFENSKQFIMQKTEQVQKFNRDKAQFNDALAKFKVELQRAQPVIRDMQSRMDEYTFEIQPHLDKINDAINRLK
ncbi:hypothetical protein [Nicoliella lavandulae]|uniref:YtxH domain-containing protein n=1 Tax=Nicoliella lavandulae TaxID=3082954 RepID=A0ABU8SKQ0_9LACO